MALTSPKRISLPKNSPKFTSKDEEILKSLHEQINQRANYDQWMRASKMSVATVSTAAEKMSSASSLRSKDAAPRRPTERTRQQEIIRDRIKLLETRLATQRQTLVECKQREQQLITSNNNLVKQINSRESETFASVNANLELYEKCRVGVSNLGKLFHEQQTESQNNLENLRLSLAAKTADLEKWVQEYGNILKSQQKQLYDLQCYKDKEYHAKSMQIADLEKSVSILDTNNEMDLEEFEQVMQHETEKYQEEQKNRRMSAYAQSSAKVLQQTHPSLREMAVQNKRLMKEITLHEYTRADTINQIATLEADVSSLRQLTTNVTRRCIFPELCQPRSKATPDMDLQLEIPTQKWLPI